MTSGKNWILELGASVMMLVNWRTLGLRGGLEKLAGEEGLEWVFDVARCCD